MRRSLEYFFQDQSHELNSLTTTQQMIALRNDRYLAAKNLGITAFLNCLAKVLGDRSFGVAEFQIGKIWVATQREPVEPDWSCTQVWVDDRPVYCCRSDSHFIIPGEWLRELWVYKEKVDGELEFSRIEKMRSQKFEAIACL